MEIVTKRAIDRFYANKRIAVIGGSRDKRKYAQVLLILVAVLCAPFFLFGQEADTAARTDRSLVIDRIPNDSAWTKDLDALMSRYQELGEFNGAVLVVREGRILVNKEYGRADMKEKTLNGPETKFFIGSISKQFTAAMILKLVEMGRLSLDSTLAEALPYYRKDTGSIVKIRHLLEHTSGISSFTDSLEQDIQACFSIKEFVLKYCSRDLISEPGVRFRYNNGGDVILGAVIEQAIGLTYEEALRQYIFAPQKARKMTIENVVQDSTLWKNSSL